MSQKKVNLVSKISMKTVLGNVKAHVPEEEGAAVPLVRVMGAANGIKSGSSTYGEWIAFTGQFMATKIENGEQYRASKLFLPEVATSLLVPVVQESGGPVEFAFDLGVKKADNAVGYEYIVVPLLEVAESDAVKALEARLPALPALTAPVSAPAETAKPKAKK